jgi:hypothetical protein
MERKAQTLIWAHGFNRPLLSRAADRKSRRMALADLRPLSIPHHDADARSATCWKEVCNHRLWLSSRNKSTQTKINKRALNCLAPHTNELGVTVL